MLSNGGEKMEYEYLNIIIGELKILRKLQLKLLSQYCENITPEQVKLLYLIKKEKLKQKEIAAILGIDQRVYSNYEIGKREIPTHLLIKLADYYNTTTDYILGRTNNYNR